MGIQKVNELERSHANKMPVLHNLIHDLNGTSSLFKTMKASRSSKIETFKPSKSCKLCWNFFFSHLLWEKRLIVFENTQKHMLITG